MKGFNFRIKISPCGPLQKFDDKAIDLLKKPRKAKRPASKRSPARKR